MSAADLPVDLSQSLYGIDRIGLEVKNVEQVCKNLEASGIKLDGAYRKATAMNLAVCVLTDPWGTYIEISEGLAAVK